MEKERENEDRIYRTWKHGNCHDRRNDQTGDRECKDILGSARTEQTVKKAEDAFGITGCKDNAEVAGQADILFLAVKPQMYPDVIGHIKDAVKPETIVVSIAPGKTIAWLTELFGKEVKLVRCMPNTPALVGEGCTGVCKAENVTDAEMEQVLSLLNSFGKAYIVPEN